MYLNVNTPFFWGFLDEGFLYDRDPDINAPRICMEFFLYTSIPGRCGLWTGMTEWGTQHARIPTHYIYREPAGGLDVPLDFVQIWDSFSYNVACTEFAYLKNKSCKILLKNRQTIEGKYMFTLDWAEGGYGEMAAGHKTGHVLDAGSRIFIQPNNRIVQWMDGGSFTCGPMKERPKWLAFSKEFSCEAAGGRWVSASEEELYWYDFKEGE